jgi:NAD(P)-dependent dehydrogenase (short-subunit alcohol dehydrogenase family)
MDLGLDQRTVVLIGEDDPLRAGLAAVFADEGARVVSTTLAPDDGSRAAAIEGRVDVVVLLEGPTDARPVDWLLEPEAIDRAWDPVVAAVTIYQQVVASMRERGFGRLIYVGSANSRDVAEIGSDLDLVAGLGMRALHKVIADECGPDGITTATVLRGRIATVEDVAACTAWLSSDVAGYLTGVTISIDGGLASPVF